MSALFPTTTSFSTFHSRTAAIPAEITSHIIEYVIADAQLLPMGGGVGIRRAHHPLASTSRALRTNYLSHPYPVTAKHRTTAPVRTSLFCTKFGFSASPTLTIKLPQTGGGRPTMPTKLLSSSIPLGTSCKSLGFNSTFLAGRLYLL
jgi:hypothetical protein